MGYDRGGSIPFDFEPNGKIHLVQKLKGKLSPRSYPIQFERKWKYSFLSVDRKNDCKTGIFWYHGGPIEGPLKTTLGQSQHYRIEGLKGSLIMPRNATVSRTATRLIAAVFQIWVQAETHVSAVLWM